MSVTTRKISYPPTLTVDQTDNYHGTSVADPYRWLEDENAPETREWITRQNAVTFDYLRSLPTREPLRQRITELWNRPRYFPPTKRGNSYFYLKNDGLQNQHILYRQQTLDSVPEIVLNPNTFSDDGTVAISAMGIAANGKMIAYALSEGGSDWQKIFVRDLETGKDLEDRLEWVKFSAIAWTHDHKGFFYCRFPAPQKDQAYSQANRDHTICYHRLGSSQEEDIVVHSDPNHPERLFYAEISDDGRYLLVSATETAGPVNMLGYIDLIDPLQPRPDGTLTMLVDRLEASYECIGNDGETFYIKTDSGAPRGQIICIDAGNPAPEARQIVVPETEDAIYSASIVGDRFYITRLHNAHSIVCIYDLQGNFLQHLPTPPQSMVMGMNGRRDDTEIFYLVTSYLLPMSTFRYDIATGTNEQLHASAIDFNEDEYETHQIWCTSKDGTRVPMFVTHRKGIALDGKNPTILYGYGGFNVPLTPGFSVQTAVWLEQGGVYAAVNLRGGGEFGEEWYSAGTKERKQNVFDDCIAAAEKLIADGYTSPNYLAVKGGSNGGLLVGAVMTQRPDLMAVAIPMVGVLDMLRYHLFTIGRAWAGDYGTSDSPEMFPVLYGYSPLHNLKEGTHYPATLVMTGDHDDRVVPAHSFKFAARLQACQGGEAPVLIRIETRGGHGAGKPLAMQIEEAADELAFILENTGEKPGIGSLEPSEKNNHTI